jgi:aerobic-type carbon monoxide dehydrogenase small subunit (CoxS/CutS family)
VRAAISGNICRCTGYRKIVDAMRATSEATTERERVAAGA